MSSTQLIMERKYLQNYKGWYAGMKECIGKYQEGGGALEENFFSFAGPSRQNKQCYPANRE